MFSFCFFYFVETFPILLPYRVEVDKHWEVLICSGSSSVLMSFEVCQQDILCHWLKFPSRRTLSNLIFMQHLTQMGLKENETADTTEIKETIENQNN